MSVYNLTLDKPLGMVDVGERVEIGNKNNRVKRISHRLKTDRCFRRWLSFHLRKVFPWLYFFYQALKFSLSSQIE